MSTPPISHWPHLSAEPLAPLTGGLINTTFTVGSPPVAVLQQVNPIFPPEVNEDIEAVTQHLRMSGMPTPSLVRTGDGQLCVPGPAGAWRVLTWVPGQTWHKLTSPKQAAAAGRLVARWHRATLDLVHDFRFSRPLAHHTPHHMDMLRTALDTHADHRLRDDVAPLAEELLTAWETWDGTLDQPTRISHGDLKISNLRFDADADGICLLDLDTMGQLPLSVELGDAWRSWCNPSAEDAAETAFSLELFEASARAYLEVWPVDAAERVHLAGGCERICLELAARFAADALNESYFGWNPDVAATRGDHNLLRARGQLALGLSAAEHRSEMERIIRQA
ncbi:MAG: phosphotransferase [Proteobacteria bacterium]|nr:phosphotransferase [Pseudomonadota bacterium]MCP4921857.1 phosphotransferase [Pseudomonadota bacterium]